MNIWAIARIPSVNNKLHYQAKYGETRAYGPKWFKAASKTAIV